MSTIKYAIPLWILFAFFFVAPLITTAHAQEEQVKDTALEQVKDTALETEKTRPRESAKTEAIKPSILQNARERLEKTITNVKNETKGTAETRATKKMPEEKSVNTRIEKIVDVKKERIEKPTIDSTQKVEEKRAETLQKQEARKEQIAEKKQNLDERQKELLEKRKERVAAYFGKMFKRLDAAVERLHVLAERIDSRIKKFEERKADVTEAKQALEKAKSLIENARASLAEAKASVQNVLSGENPKDIFADAQKSVKAVVSHIKEAHAALIQSIVALKGNSEAEKSENAAPTE